MPSRLFRATARERTVYQFWLNLNTDSIVTRRCCGSRAVTPRRRCDRVIAYVLPNHPASLTLGQAVSPVVSLSRFPPPPPPRPLAS